MRKAEQRKLAKRAKKGEKVSAKVQAKKLRRAEREVKLAKKIMALPDEKFGAISADVPWKFLVDSEAGMDRAADNHYPTQTIDEIMKFGEKVQSISADDCTLFLWTTIPHEAHAHEVLKAWGFTYVSQMVWVKPHPITGYWFLGQHEILLVGTKGNVVAPAPGTQWPSVLMAPAGEHSEKPAAVAEMIEAYYPKCRRSSCFVAASRALAGRHGEMKSSWHRLRPMRRNPKPRRSNRPNRSARTRRNHRPNR
jgi:N6-adenosine-specific RNA methylase IME4